MEVIAQKLGDGSRDVAWRLPLGESGILDFFAGVLCEDELSRGVHVHALRLVGNSCADTDQNRGRMVRDDRLSAVARHLQDESSLPFTVPVLYNIMVDYEPAQLLASQSGLSSKLIAHLATFGILRENAAIASYAYKVLALLASQEGEPSAADPSSVDVLLGLAAGTEDADDFASLVGVAVAYLAKESFQSRLVREKRMGLFLDVFHRAHTTFEPGQEELEPETAARLKQLRASLLMTLADLSANDSFPSFYPPSSPVPQSLLAWVRGNNTALQSAACLALGNLSRSDETSVGLVERDSIHLPLRDLLSNPAVSDSQLLHLALSFCKNLAIPPPNKTKLGGLLEPTCIPRIFAMDTLPQVQFSAVSLTRLLLVNCPENVALICAPLSAGQADSNHDRSGVSGILSLFDRSDAEPTRLEASRCIASLCRVLHSPTFSPDVLLHSREANPPKGANSDESSAVEAEHGAAQDGADGAKERRFLYGKHNLSQPLAFLVTQQKWPTLRSEAWFVLALMSRSKDGAVVVDAVLQAQAATEALEQALTGRGAPAAATLAAQAPEAVLGSSHVDYAASSLAMASLQLEPRQADPEQQTNVAKADRENALILATELLKNAEGWLPMPRVALLRNLVKEGTERILADRT
ncbi:hypothetical protein CDD83_6234 [Cordyceps sp. RAO-2017]|nr:hypothetical protein CDD83_6234 [Cordyceps sp. RAO-2017]